MGGTNDFCCNESIQSTKVLQFALSKLVHTKVIVVGVPYRYDHSSTLWVHA